MNTINKLKYLLVVLLLCTVGCTDLSETLYDTIASDNFYQTHDDVIRGYVRPFEHCFWSIGQVYSIQENSGDMLATYNREGDWLDGQVYFRQHYHTWTIDDPAPRDTWFAIFQGIMLCNGPLEDLNKLNPTQFDFTETEFNNFKANLRTLRAWLYISAFDLFRNIPLATSLDASKNSSGQIEPQEMFNFIEKELKESIALLPKKAGTGGNQLNQGQWNQAGAAALLVRLYLNAEKWIGTPKYTECAQYAQEILDGKYGTYSVESRWDAPFDWNNETSDEVIYAFTCAKERAHWQYSGDMYWWSIPAMSPAYFGFLEWGTQANPKFALQPSLDVDGNPYNFTLGMPVAKFKKYPEDYRLKLYKNLSEPSKREGMFLYGYLVYQDNDGQPDTVKKPGNAYNLYIRDQVGAFGKTLPGTPIENKTSNMNTADHNSGWHVVKYPFYRSGDKGAIESDYALLRLPEVIYSLAECKFRAGDKTGAGQLLNQVRKRYYPADKYADYLYAPDGKIELTAEELLDEWGREFVTEGRRRTDLIRWNKFSSGTWWDKQPDADNHTEILPIARKYLNANPNLKQNPGYDDISR